MFIYEHRMLIIWTETQVLNIKCLEHERVVSKTKTFIGVKTWVYMVFKMIFWMLHIQKEVQQSVQI